MTSKAPRAWADNLMVVLKVLKIMKHMTKFKIPRLLSCYFSPSVTFKTH